MKTSEIMKKRMELRPDSAANPIEGRPADEIMAQNMAPTEEEQTAETAETVANRTTSEETTTEEQEKEEDSFGTEPKFSPWCTPKPKTKPTGKDKIRKLQMILSDGKFPRDPILLQYGYWKDYREVADNHLKRARDVANGKLDEVHKSLVYRGINTLIGCFVLN